MKNDYMADWKKNSIKIGAPTCILAAFTAFIPVLYRCSKYQCWPKMETVLSAWAMTALSFGAFYFVEPVSYYAALGMSGTYLGFLSGNIGNMRVPCAALALDVTDSKSGTIPVSYTHLDVYKRQGQALARLCYETLRDYGAQAVEACKAHVVTPALENIIEANVYLSGVGADNVNCAAAHSFYNGVTATGTEHAYHCLLYTSRCV